jgi:hypothetical protein
MAKDIVPSTGQLPLTEVTGTGPVEGDAAMTAKNGSWLGRLSKRQRRGLIIGVVLLSLAVIGIVVWQVISKVRARQASDTPSGQNQGQIQSTGQYMATSNQHPATATPSGSTAFTPPVGKGDWLGWAQTKYLIVLYIPL